MFNIKYKNVLNFDCFLNVFSLLDQYVRASFVFICSYFIVTCVVLCYIYTLCTACLWFRFIKFHLFKKRMILRSCGKRLIITEMQLWMLLSQNAQQLLLSAVRRSDMVLSSWFVEKEIQSSSAVERFNSFSFLSVTSFFASGRDSSTSPASRKTNLSLWVDPENATICMWGALNEAVKWKWIISVHSDLWAQIRAHQQPPARQAVCF